MMLVILNVHSSSVHHFILHLLIVCIKAHFNLLNSYKFMFVLLNKVVFH